MTMTMIQCLGLSLRGHGPHASYEPTGQCLFKTNGLKDKLRRLGCRCATQLLAADALYMTKGSRKTTDSYRAQICTDEFKNTLIPIELKSVPMSSKTTDSYRAQI